MPSRRVDGMVGAAEGAGRVYWTGRPCLPPHDKVDFANRFQVDGQLKNNEQPASGRPDS
jgi:hypothetical protein